MDQSFWDFDNSLIQACQYFHLRSKKGTCNQALGGIFAALGFLLNYVFSLELWMIIVLTLTMFQQDGPAERLNYYILLNILFVQTPKRYLLRKRPGKTQPPRAVSLLNMPNSSVPSAFVTAATTFTFAVLSMNNWMGGLASLNVKQAWSPYVFAIVVYLVSSFLQVHLGACFPSDCLFSLIPIVLIIAVHWCFAEIGRAAALCPICDGDFCYFTPGAQNNVVQNIVTRQNLNMWDLHGVGNTLLFIAMLLCSILAVYPLDYWQKTTYFFSMITAVWIFQNTLLCPNARNNFYGVYSPDLTLQTDVLPSDRTMLVISFLVFTLGVNWIVTNILAKRTGAVLSSILVAVFFCVIVFWTEHCLLTVRLLIVDAVNQNGLGSQ